MHRGFYLLYSLGLLKKDSKFKYHYAVKKWIHKTDYVVDIGANLGYFAKTFSKLAHEGKVICIEPIPLFYQTLTHFLGSKKNVEIHNIALGNENGFVTMALPETDGFIRTGLPHVIKDDNIDPKTKTQQVSVLKAHEFLFSLPKIDYLKCDIEGYEAVVFEDLRETLKKFRPIVQVEIAPENRSQLLQLFTELNYQQFGLVNFKLTAENGAQQEEGDFLFIPLEKRTAFIAGNKP
ncbi:MAG: FkbM family methyltransferase [Bacteroidetes bacterium]|nr:FkbM family methyltransferase [Bacteroidota bacterium]